MSDENLESNSPEGSAGQPTPPTSSGANVQQPSSFDADALLKLVEPLIERKVQSVKDRRIAELEKTVSGIQPVLERFKGLVPDDKLREIQKDLEFEDLKKRVYGNEPTGAPAGGNQPESAAGLDNSVLNDVFGLVESQFEPNDVAYAALKTVHGNDRLSLLKSAIQLRKQQLNVKPAGPANALPPSGGAGGGAQPSVQESTNNFIKAMRAAPRGPKGDSERRALKDKAIREGVDVHNIDFT